LSREVCTAAIDGAAQWLETARERLDAAIKAKGPEQPVAFPDTAYYLPVVYSLIGEKVERLEDLKTILDRAKELIPARPDDSCWLPYLGSALDAGAAALFCCEAIEACKYVMEEGEAHPVHGIWRGAASDVIMRERGVEFVDGTAPGFAAITGAAPDNETAVKIARELQEKNLYVFMAGPANGVTFAEQLEAEGVQLGWETRLVPFGRDVSALIYALGFANRAAMAFGGVKPGDFEANLRYNKTRVFAFVLALGEVDASKYAVAAGAINYGFPVIADTDIPEILPSGVCTYEHVVANVPHESMVEKALEVRGCKIKVTKVPIPVPYGSAFEGELIRKKEVHAEFGGNKTTAFEFLTSVDMDEIKGGQVEIVGPDIDEVDEGTALPLGIWVEVAGRKMQDDFEPILERQIHHLLNGAEGVWHMGQRDIVWTRVSKTAFSRGFRLRHYGDILIAKLLSEYPSIVDKVNVTMITDEAEVEKRIEVARKVYDERNRRLEAMTDESVDTFYSCLLCQSFAPDHVCVITPERAGLCGAYNWLDGKAAHEIDSTGPNQPVPKGDTLDTVRGVFSGVNDYVYQNSHKSVDRICCYSIMDAPMTSCGCFEVICAYVPECNGIMAVNREYTGETPVGMKFSTLAGNVGGGMQTPGFFGCGKIYLTSRKFAFAEGGHKRLVWMPKELKEQLGPDLERRFADMGIENSLELIADETVGIDAESVRQHMERMQHPALSLDNMEELALADAGAAPEAAAADAEGPAPPASETRQAPPAPAAAPPSSPAPAAGDLGSLKQELAAQLKNELAQELREVVAREVARDIINTLTSKYLGGEQPARPEQSPAQTPAQPAPQPAPPQQGQPAPASQEQAPSPAPEAGAAAAGAPAPAASAAPAGDPAQRIEALLGHPLKQDAATNRIHEVTIGAPGAAASRKTLTLGGAMAMPFQAFDGPLGQRPRVGLEVLDLPHAKYPELLRRRFGEDLVQDPAAWAKACVEQYGAEMINLRLEGTHPEKGNRSPEQAVDTVKAVLAAVDVPLMVSGPAPFERMNEVMKAVAQACAGENLLLNWAEQDNYKTIAGAALAFDHCLVAQSPIDVNIAKQLNILLGNMDLGMDRIVIDPTTGALGYGVEYTYSVMERIRLTALSGDEKLASPMIVLAGAECSGVKEYKATAEEFPAWGELSRRAMLWELATATSLLYAGADCCVMSHPDAAMELHKTIDRLWTLAANQKREAA